MLRPTVVEIDLAAIRHNISRLRSVVGVPLMAVVKADAYGHGALPVATAAIEAGAERLAVATVEEGIQLRTAGVQVPILVMGWVSQNAIEPALRYGLTLTVVDLDSLRYISHIARSRGLPAVVHLKLDTGMGRLGFPAWEPTRLAADLTSLAMPGVRIEGVYTHLSSADADEEYTRRQLEHFDAAIALLRSHGWSIPVVHAANSAGALRFPAARYDTVRVGIAMYGLDPFPGAARQLGLRPALKWRSVVAQVKTIEPGIGISYAHTVMPEKPVRVAIVPVGYGDGYGWGLSNSGQVLIGGRRVPVLGRVCMDQIIVGEVPDGVRSGDEVVLLGSQGNDQVTASELAEKLNTIPYEIVTRIGRRVPRRYLDAEKGSGGL